MLITDAPDDFVGLEDDDSVHRPISMNQTTAFDLAYPPPGDNSPFAQVMATLHDPAENITETFSFLMPVDPVDLSVPSFNQADDAADGETDSTRQLQAPPITDGIENVHIPMLVERFCNGPEGTEADTIAPTNDFKDLCVTCTDPITGKQTPGPARKHVQTGRTRKHDSLLCVAQNIICD